MSGAAAHLFLRTHQCRSMVTAARGERFAGVFGT